MTSPDGSRERAYRVLFGDEEADGPSAACLSGAVDVGFSLVVFEGGSVDDRVACAKGRHVTALYALDEGDYVSYILGAPAFVNERFGELYAGGVPALTPLAVKSDGPATGTRVLQSSPSHGRSASGARSSRASASCSTRAGASTPGRGEPPYRIFMFHLAGSRREPKISTVPWPPAMRRICMQAHRR